MNVGVVVWGSAIQRFEKRSSGPDGSMKSRKKGGRSGKDSFIVYNAARFVSPESKLKIQRPDDCDEGKEFR
jgi:hypothetical protein